MTKDKQLSKTKTKTSSKNSQVILNEEQEQEEQEENDASKSNNQLLIDSSDQLDRKSTSSSNNKSKSLSQQPPRLSLTSKSIHSKSNIKFHQLFPSISLNEHVIETYNCAYVKNLNLFQGVLFLSKNYICFHSKILKQENILILNLSHINSITRTTHAKIFPTAIRIDTLNSSYVFTSFLSRSTTIDHLNNLLKNYRNRESDSVDAEISTSSTNSNLTSPRSSFQNDPQLTLVRNSLSKNMLTSEEPNGDKKDIGEQKESYLSQESSTLTNDAFISSALEIKQDQANQYQTSSQLNPMSQSTYTNNNHVFMPNDFVNYDSSSPNNNLFQYYDFDWSEKKVTVSSRQKKKGLLNKVKILFGSLIPGFSDNITRIDSLLPICFIMCILLLLNACVLLKKVNEVDEIFVELLAKR